MAEIILITGGLESGKTSLCQELSRIAVANGIDLGGLISPAVITAGEKTAIHVQDLKTGIQKRLAVLNDGQDHPLQTKRWNFDPQTVEWGNRILAEATPCDLLMIDELGPLEFERDQGWINGIRAVSGQDFRAALVVIRPSLLKEARGLWPVSRVIDLDLSSPHPGELFSSLRLD